MVLVKKTFTVLFFIIIAFASSLTAYSAVFINEVLVNGISDPDSEWVELYNDASSSINLSNWKISETASSNFSFSSSMPPKGFIVLAGDFATFAAIYPNANLANVINITTSNFNLADSSGEIKLYDYAGNLADSLAYAQASGKTFENVSIGRYPDGSPGILNLSTLTPLKKNDNKAPALNRWINPAGNNTRVAGLVNIVANITDDASEVEAVVLNFNGTNFLMIRHLDTWSFTWNTSLNAQKSYNISLVFNDSYGKTGIDALFNISVDNTPFINSFLPQNLSQVLFENSTLDFSINASDPDDPILSFSWFIDGILNKTNTPFFSYKPGFGDNGTHAVNVTISDPSSNQVSVKWDLVVKNINRKPIFNSIGGKFASKGSLLSFNISATDADEDILTFSTNHSSIELTKVSNSMATVFWKPSNTDLGQNIINFTVSDGFATDSEVISIFVNYTDNSAPVITSSPKIFTAEKEQYSYDAEATDSDGDTIFFSIKSNASGMVIDRSTGLVTFTPASTGFFSVNVSATDLIAITNQSFNIRVIPGNKIKIMEVDAKIDNKKSNNLDNNSIIRKEAESGSELEFEITVKNDFNRVEDVKIEGIQVKVTIEDIDNGDDLEGKSSEFDLSAQDDKKLKFKFSLPVNIEEGTYTVLIEAEGDDEIGALHEQFFKLKLEVEKKKHDLRFAEFGLSPEIISCQREILAKYEILNLGQEDEEGIAIEIKNENLGLMSRKEGISIDSGTEDNVFSGFVRTRLDKYAEAGDYVLIANVYSSDNKLHDTRTAVLKVQDCTKTKADKGPVVLALGKDISTGSRPIVELQPINRARMTILLISTFIFTLFFVFVAVIAVVKR